MSENFKWHQYRAMIEWTGNLGSGTSGYRSYARDHEIRAEGKPMIPGSSDPAFRGDRTRYNPEDLLVASLSACHMLWYLHLCTDQQIIVRCYRDAAEGTMREAPDGSGRFTEVVLRPEVILQAGANRELAHTLHEKAHQLCFIANSVNFPVRCEPIITIE